MPSTTAVRITTISAAQNKRGKDCFEGGMETGAFTWFKDMGGNSNWMYIKVVNVSNQHVSLALWLLYEASTEPLVDPLTGSGSIQVGFFNQSKNLNRQVPLFELAEESKPGLEIGAGQSSTLKVRINDLSSHHQNQRFIIVIGPADAPIRGSRSVPIEIMSKPRVDSEHPASGTGAAASGQQAQGQASAVSGDDPRLAGGTRRQLSGGDSLSDQPPLKRQHTDASAGPLDGAVPKSFLGALVSLTDPAPDRARKLALILTLLDGLPLDEKRELHERLGAALASTGDASDSLRGADANGGVSGRARSSSDTNTAADPNASTAGVVVAEALAPPPPVDAAASAADRPTTRPPKTALVPIPASQEMRAALSAASDAAPPALSASIADTHLAQSVGAVSPPDPLGAGAVAAGDDMKTTDADDQNRKPRQQLQPLVNAVLAFQQSKKQGQVAETPSWVASALDKYPAGESLDLSEEQMSNFFVDPNQGVEPSLVSDARRPTV